MGLTGVELEKITLDAMLRPLIATADTVEAVMAEQAGEFLLARAAQPLQPRRRLQRQAQVHRHPAEARLHRAGTRQGSDRRDPPGRHRSQAPRGIRRARASDWSGADRRRGVLHRAGRHGGEQHRDHRDRAGDPLARAEIGPHHLRGVRQPDHRARDHGGARLPDRRAAQPHIHRVRGAVRRPRCRFRNPVQRALSRRPLRGRRFEARAGARRAQCGRAADACGRRDRGRISLISADRLSRRLRARPDRRHGHAGRIPHQHHAVARAAHGPQSEGRTRAARLRVSRAGRQVHGRPPHRDHRRRRHRVARRDAAALLSAVRLQSDQPAQPEGRIDRDLPRSAPRSHHRSERDQRAYAQPRGDQADRGTAVQATRGLAGPYAELLRAAGSGQEARRNQSRARQHRAFVQARGGADAADRRGERRRAQRGGHQSEGSGREA